MSLVNKVVELGMALLVGLVMLYILYNVVIDLFKENPLLQWGLLIVGGFVTFLIILARTGGRK